jgi:hypothetical protein
MSVNYFHQITLIKNRANKNILYQNVYFWICFLNNYISGTNDDLFYLT